ncbi:uncharacterized protein J8A68_004170 [[Candida] subhashii]|uniref:Oligomycin resistance ATP-dependent permease YOR1 n=1 Tax=[Candida] subhashii TaxID=561895 RepID=A0A8J5QJM1_9ASCO|nr:uncharacterized protein J8A68_004170 [[Candida] subhashii]KAG7662276.1 hypothetical protein J8A68_004170 [[Candida] subhashii]
MSPQFNKEEAWFLENHPHSPTKPRPAHDIDSYNINDSSRRLSDPRISTTHMYSSFLRSTNQFNDDPFSDAFGEDYDTCAESFGMYQQQQQQKQQNYESNLHNSQYSPIHEKMNPYTKPNETSKKTGRPYSQGGDDTSTLEEQPELQRQDRWFSWLFSKQIPPIPSDDEREFYPWKICSPFKRLGFWWLWPIIKKGYLRTLHPEDLFKLTPELTVEEMHQKWEAHLDTILQSAKFNHLKENHDLSNFDWPTYAIPYALFLTFKWPYLFSSACLALAFVCTTTSPLLTRQLIDYVQFRYFGLETTYNKGIKYSVLSVCLIFINGLLLNHFFHNAMIVGAQSKAVLTKALLTKSFKLSSKSRYQFPVGRITSLMSTDLSRIDMAIGFQPLIFCFPIPIVISIALLVNGIGIASLAGIFLFIVSLFVCAGLTRVLFKARQQGVKYTDERVSLMREILNNLKNIKYYAWEAAYKLSITKVREKEMKYLFTIKVLRNFITAYAVTLPVLTSMISFVTMWATGSMRSPGEVFSSLSLYAILAQAIMLLPIALATGADALIGFTRCRQYLSADEFSYELNYNLMKQEKLFYTGHAVPTSLKGSVIEVKHANFEWEAFADDLDSELWETTNKKKNKKSNKKKKDEKSQFTYEVDSAASSSSDTLESSSIFSSKVQFSGLQDINLSIKKSEFIIITGLIGCGKTSLLHALAGIMKLINPGTGSVKIYDDVLLCSTTWIQNATVRDNIIFGKPFDIKKYNKVLYACALYDDLKTLPAGDMTEIGERGITLSGGQKARINLARACYSDAEVLLLDDVISAVDSRVARHIVNELFKGLLKDKTIVLATHQLGILGFADRVVFLNKNGTIDVGGVGELTRRNSDFRSLIEYNSQEEEGDKPLVHKATTKKESGPNDDEIVSSLSDGRTTSVEETPVNAISWDVYKKYIQLGSGVFGRAAVPVLLLVIIFATFFQVFTNTWLSFWVEHKFIGKSDHFYVAIYVLLAVLTVVFTAIEFTMLAYMQNTSAEILNVKAVAKILHVPMSFIDTTPLGRVLNRFTKDTDDLDNEIGEQMRLFIFPLALIFGIMILCTCYLPYFALAVPFLAIGFVFLANVYQASSREIKRVEGVQRSMVYSNFNETLTGMATIKAYDAEADFIAKNDYYINKMNEAYFLSIASQRWLCVHLDMLTSSFALIISMLCITEQFKISASSTGLLLSYVIQIVGVLSLSVRSMTEVENKMSSVERIHEYAFHLPQEAAYHKVECQPPHQWPSAGHIRFCDVHLRYRSNLPLVLKGLNANFLPGEKVGIVGRTGAGKSSIMAALYRLTELEKGMIEIDGIDISQIGLHDLRSKLSIIPQDPVIFQGTIRKNLDPFNEYDDHLLWDALKTAGLIDAGELPHVKLTSEETRNRAGLEQLHKFHLDRAVEDDGNNYSLGEKQLIALARSLVRNSNILVLDEATSSVDFETDARIQNTLATEFKKSTVLCIAHRLKTILNYDTIMVMDQGKIVEKGGPLELFNRNGIFRQMCEKANIRVEDF